MDQSQDQIPRALFSRHLFCKRTLEFVFSVSVLSFFLCCSSGFSVHYPQSLNAYFSTCLLSMFTHTLERKYMFLICNGILAFLAKNSLMASSPPMLSAFDHTDFQPSINLSETKTPVSDMVYVVVPLMAQEQENLQEQHGEEVSEAEEEEDSTLYAQTKGRENEPCISEEEENEGNDEKEEDEEGGTESEAMVTQEYDEAEEDTAMTTNNDELANTDELNRKFEEFIRRMKEEIRIEAQRQLIAV